MKKMLTGVGILFAALPAFAATPIDLSHQPLSSFAKQNVVKDLVEVSRNTDFNQTLHIRMKQMHAGHRVLGGDAIMHVAQSGQGKAALLSPASSMNGLVYQGLDKDLENTPNYVFDAKYKEKATASIIESHQQKMNKTIQATEQENELLVYVDEKNKAHWAFKISFRIDEKGELPQKPVYIVDAAKLTVYETYDNIKTIDKVKAGGFGGNHKTGQKIFDGLDGHQWALDMQRDETTGMCIMKNDEVVVRDYRTRNKPVQFDCKAVDPEHNNIYWNGNFDQVETTWSPSNDVLFGAKVTSSMFRTWYDLPMLVKNGKPMFLPTTVHDPMTNAYWDGTQAVFGNSKGSRMFNPFTQLDTVVHEIAHGFTEHHSNLEYRGHSGGLNEAFSDMAGIAGEYFAFGKTDFLVGNGDVKAEGEALRYMDKPSKDCGKSKPGENCSIDHVSEYYSGLNVHYSSGIFNRVYYNIATAPGWDPKKAFDIMVKANVNYWTPRTNFTNAACGVLKATKDYKYDATAVLNAFKLVGIDTTSCR